MLKLGVQDRFRLYCRKACRFDPDHSYKMKEQIEIEIRRAINRHLVQHVQMNGDTRDRIDILVDEASVEIIKS